jgi:hypothetical protein
MSGSFVPSYLANAYLTGAMPSQQPVVMPNTGFLQTLLGKPTVSPLESRETANRSALEVLTNLAGNQESGTPAGAPAPPGSPLDATAGMGRIGGMMGSLAGGRLGGIAGRSLGSAIGSAVAANRAQEIADMYGLTNMTSPAAAAGRSALNAGLTGLVGSLADSIAPGYNARSELADRFNEMTARTEMDPYMQMEMHRQMYSSMEEAPPETHFAMDPTWGGPAPGEPTDNSAQDMSGFGEATAESSPGSTEGGDKARRGGLATDNGFLGPEKFAQGGAVVELQGGGKIAVGPGGGLDDLIPTSINGKRAAALSDGEFVIPADVVSMMGDGSSNAGARRLYDLVRQIRQSKTGTSRQAGPLPVGEILKRTMR